MYRIITIIRIISFIIKCYLIYEIYKLSKEKVNT